MLIPCAHGTAGNCNILTTVRFYFDPSPGRKLWHYDLQVKLRGKKLLRRRKKAAFNLAVPVELAQGDLIAQSQKPDLVIAFVGAIGVQLPKVESIFEERIKKAGFSVHLIKISDDVLAKLKTTRPKPSKETKAARLKRLMDGGNLFSMNLGVGSRLVRKNEDGAVTAWDLASSTPRIQMHSQSYFELEAQAAAEYMSLTQKR